MSLPLPDNPAQLNERYQQLRAVQRALNTRLADAIEFHTLRTAGRQLGLFPAKQLDDLTGTEWCVLYDFCLYHTREDQRTPIDRYWSQNPPAPDSDEWAIFEAMRVAWFSLFQVRDVVEGIGVVAYDLLRREDYFLSDMNLAATVGLGTILASQIIEPEGVAMCTGATLPVDPEALDAIIVWLGEFDATEPEKNPANLPPDREDRLAAGILRACLANEASDQIHYRSPDEAPPSPDDADDDE